MVSKIQSEWQRAPTHAKTALQGAWQWGVPAEASALYSRWWQLETWLRSLVYLERSARDGRGWAEGLPNHAASREEKEQHSGYMATPDSDARLAYLDAGWLVGDVITDDWLLYSDSLILKEAWIGRMVELKNIRNRIGHCRRPHSDDLGRIEQMLRDLESGAFRAMAAYARTSTPSLAMDDAVVEAWVGQSHETAHRLIDHARSKYEVNFNLAYSRRPWAESRSNVGPVTGLSGYLWHARWNLSGGVPLDFRTLWNDFGSSTVKDSIVFLTASDPFAIELTFAAVDDGNRIADAIGQAFDAVLRNWDHSHGTSLDAWAQWKRQLPALGAKAQVCTGWAIVDDTTTPINIFGV